VCDYSLTGIPNRLAVEGEKLVIHRFRTGSMGLASPCLPMSSLVSDKQTPAVCVPPGARLLLQNISTELQEQFGVKATEEVTFTQLSAIPYQFRDAVRFSNGREILLQKLRCGQPVEVLALSSDAKPEEREEIEVAHQQLR